MSNNICASAKTTILVANAGPTCTIGWYVHRHVTVFPDASFLRSGHYSTRRQRRRSLLTLGTRMHASPSHTGTDGIGWSSKLGGITATSRHRPCPEAAMEAKLVDSWHKNARLLELHRHQWHRVVVRNWYRWPHAGVNHAPLPTLRQQDGGRGSTECMPSGTDRLVNHAVAKGSHASC